MIKVRVVLVKELANHHHLTVFQFDNGFQRHPLVITLADIADQSFGLRIAVDGMTLESVVELENGKMVMVSEFFNEDDPDFDHSLDQKMVINRADLPGVTAR